MNPYESPPELTPKEVPQQAPHDVSRGFGETAFMIGFVFLFVLCISGLSLLI